jgi:hypothetical protein
MGMGDLVKRLSERRGGRGIGMHVKRGAKGTDGGSSDPSMDELREFLEADHLGVQADPQFKEELRKKLWKLVQAQANQRRDRDEQS